MFGLLYQDQEVAPALQRHSRERAERGSWSCLGTDSWACLGTEPYQNAPLIYLEAFEEKKKNAN